MRTIRTKVYQFSELSKDVQAKVIDSNYDINVNEEWWQSVYEDAEQIGLKITEFDIDRSSYCKGYFFNNAGDTAGGIIKNHGEQCETYKTASLFLKDLQEIEDKAKIEGKDGNEDYWYSDEMEELENEFLSSLCEDYRTILQKEYEYLTSEEAIKETIEENEYEFTKEGNRF